MRFPLTTETPTGSPDNSSPPLRLENDTEQKVHVTKCTGENEWLVRSENYTGVKKGDTCDIPVASLPFGWTEGYFVIRPSERQFKGLPENYCLRCCLSDWRASGLYYPDANSSLGTSPDLAPLDPPHTPVSILSLVKLAADQLAADRKEDPESNTATSRYIFESGKVMVVEVSSANSLSAFAPSRPDPPKFEVEPVSLQE